MSTVPATVSIPKAVAAAARAISGAQFRFLTAGACWAHAVGVDKFEPSAMARAVAAKFPDLSEKTVGNYLRSALRLAKAHPLILSKHEGDADAYAVWLKDDAKAKGYTLSEPDLMAMIDNRQSAAARKAADAEQAKKNADAAAAAAAAPVIGAAADAKGTPAPADAPPASEPVPTEQRETLAADPVAPTIPPVVPVVAAPVELLRVTRAHDGSLSATINPDATRAELIDIGLMLEGEIARIMAALSTAEPRTLSGVTGETVAA